MRASPLLPPLKDLCISVIASNFQDRPAFGDLPEKSVKRITAGLPLNLPLELAARLITDEAYWKRRAAIRWANCEASPHGRSWRQLYMEKNLQDALEQFDVTTGDLAELRRLMAFSRRFVQSLRLQQLPSHLDLQLLFDAMEDTPAALALSYSLKSVGMSYDRTMFGMKLSDCRCLARALAHTETLVMLDLSNNGLDDDKMRMLASGLADNISVIHLNLSHNRISDRGVRALAKLLDCNSVLALLDLSDNQLHADSGRALARALQHSRAIVSLNLRLNRLCDEGCRALCEALCQPPAVGPVRPASSGSSSSSNANSSSASSGAAAAGASAAAAKHLAPLERLNISSNGAGLGMLPALCNMLRFNKGLVELDVSSNNFGSRMGLELLNAVNSNVGLMGMDVRGCNVGSQVETGVTEEMLSRMEKKERSRLLGSQHQTAGS
eukprot:GHRR01009602.1.p1 GENE.GHRR01009602.1~~GHRR01009602.1.p1  ORF type:complete len:439 (+),score=139.70 GHRR01009602.1:208-1524(+)